MPPPPRPPTFSQAASYRQLLDLKARLGQQAPRSKTLKVHIAHALELLDWISIRRWKEMQEVSIDLGKSRNLSILLGILIQFKKICSDRLRTQAYKPRGLSVLLQRVKSLPETSSDDINCTKRSLLQLQQRHFAKLFLHEDERGSDIDAILIHLREISLLLETADRLLVEDLTIEEENEAGDCLDEADDQAKGICDLCLAALGLDWIRVCTPSPLLSSSFRPNVLKFETDLESTSRSNGSQRRVLDTNKLPALILVFTTCL
ncbi:hypothetical protein JCM5350_005680 [Sporobolomyces pararoseus]